MREQTSYGYPSDRPSLPFYPGLRVRRGDDVPVWRVAGPDPAVSGLDTHPNEYVAVLWGGFQWEVRNCRKSGCHKGGHPRAGWVFGKFLKKGEMGGLISRSGGRSDHLGSPLTGVV